MTSAPTPRPPPPSASPPPPPMRRPRTSVTWPVSSRAPRRNRMDEPYLEIARRKQGNRRTTDEREVRDRPHEERRARRVGAAERAEPQHVARESRRVDGQPVQRVLVERVERQEPPRGARDRLESRRVDHVADLAEEPREEAAAEDHQRGDAVRRRGEEDGAEDADRGHDDNGACDLEARHDQPIRRPPSRPPRDRDERAVDREDVDDAHGDRKSTRLNSSHVKISY